MMKNKILFLGMIILVLSLSLVFVGCDGDGDGKKTQTLSGTTAVDGFGSIRFSFQGRQGSGGNDSCKFTTDLPAPNNVITSPYSYFDKTINDLTAGQEVKWTAKITVHYGDIYEVKYNIPRFVSIGYK